MSLTSHYLNSYHLLSILWTKQCTQHFEELFHLIFTNTLLRERLFPFLLDEKTGSKKKKMDLPKITVDNSSMRSLGTETSLTCVISGFQIFYSSGITHMPSTQSMRCPAFPPQCFVGSSGIYILVLSSHA